jgi:HlyD family secretion protein
VAAERSGHPAPARTPIISGHPARFQCASIAASRGGGGRRGEGSARRGYVTLGGAPLAVAAPATGQVLRVVRDSAGPVTAGAPLVELGDPHALEVVIGVLSSDAARIAPGMPVTIEAWGGDRALRGEVRRIELSAFTRISVLGVEEQRVKVIAAISDPPGSLGDGFASRRGSSRGVANAS